MIRLDTIGPYLLAQKKSAHAKAGLTLSLHTHRMQLYHTAAKKIKDFFKKGIAYNEIPESFWVFFMNKARNIVRTSGWMKNS